jgi:hypothetical protein
MLEVACSGMVRITGGPYMVFVAFGYLTSRKLGLVTKQNLFHNAVPQSNDRNVLELHKTRVGEFAHAGSGMVPTFLI